MGWAMFERVWSLVWQLDRARHSLVFNRVRFTFTEELGEGGQA